eukprot:3789-Heterococcus_DN1.PRE.1
MSSRPLSPRSPSIASPGSPGERERRLRDAVSGAFQDEGAVRSPRSRNSAASPPSRTSLDPGQAPAEPSESSDLPEYIVQEVISCTLRTATSLETLWEENSPSPSSSSNLAVTLLLHAQVGYSFEERKGFVDLLLHAVAGVCEERMDAEQRLRNELASTIEKVSVDIFASAARCGLPEPESQLCEAVLTYQYDSCCAQLTSVALANSVISSSPLHVLCCNAQEKD